jgi:hypothetical protein
MAPPRQYPDVPGFRPLRNRSVRRLNVAIVNLWGMNSSNKLAARLFEEWNKFLQSDVGRTAPDTALYGAYKTFSIAYHFVWLTCTRKPTVTPDIGVVTLLAEDLIETAEELEQMFVGVQDQVSRRAREQVSRASDNAASALLLVGLAFLLLNRRRR